VFAKQLVRREHAASEEQQHAQGDRRRAQLASREVVLAIGAQQAVHVQLIGQVKHDGLGGPLVHQLARLAPVQGVGFVHVHHEGIDLLVGHLAANHFGVEGQDQALLADVVGARGGAATGLRVGDPR